MATLQCPIVPHFHSANVIRLAEVLIKHADHILTKNWSLSYAQFKVLAILSSRQDSSQSDIATCLNLTPAAISRLTESLVSKKLVEREVKADNRRQNVLTISNTGKTVLSEVVAVIQKLETKLYGDVSSKDLETFSRVLENIVAKMSL